MDAFLNTARQQAMELLRRVFRQEIPRDTDPLLELLACLLDDGAGGIQSPPDATVSMEQWLTWNRLVSDHRQAVVRMMTRELRSERIAIPTEMDAMRTWAVRLLLGTLDRLGML